MTPHVLFSMLASIFGVALIASGDEPPKPGIVLMMADDLGWGDVGFNGQTPIRTPNLDRMAKQGVVFERFYAAGPVCSPTRASFVTGRHGHRFRVEDANLGLLPDREVTIAEVLGRAGYATGHFGKWHLGTMTTRVEDANRGGRRHPEAFSPPWKAGFEVCFSTESKVPTWDPMIRPPGSPRMRYWEPLGEDDPSVPFGTHYWDERGRIVRDNLRGDDSRIIMDRVIPFIRAAVKANRPFLAVVWFHTPHLPVVAGPRYTQMYRDRSDYERHYFGSVTAMDEQVGRLRTALGKMGIQKQTLVLFCSDNGPAGRAGDAPGSAGPLRGRKQELYEGGIRVPGVAVWPGHVEPGTRTSVPVVTSDLLPTVAAMAGVALPEGRILDGVDLVPLLEGKMPARTAPIGFQFRNQVALVDDRFKIIRRQRGSEQSAYELYDLHADPGESKDLAEQEPDVVERMSKTLQAWRASCRRSAGG